MAEEFVDFFNPEAGALRTEERKPLEVSIFGNTIGDCTWKFSFLDSVVLSPAHYIKIWKKIVWNTKSCLKFLFHYCKLKQEKDIPPNPVQKPK